MTKKEKVKPINFEKVTESDWRGLLALFIIGGGFALLAVAMALDKPWVASGILPIMALVVQWYFKAKEEAKNGA
jgi:hypothetical protein